jgi:hypothetical protein
MGCTAPENGNKLVGGGRNCTADLIHVVDALYYLSYPPNVWITIYNLKSRAPTIGALVVCLCK